jgi:Flp pilus assembly protein TadG
MFCIPHRIKALLARFRRDEKGNIAVIFAIALLPALSAVGCGVDYSEATRMRAKLQSAADAASVASISQMSAGYNAALLMTNNGTVTAAVNDATNIFNGNISGYGGFTNLAPNITVTKTGVQLSSIVSFTADVPTMFMGVVGFPKLTVSGISKSAASLPPYLDFYLMLDVSGSMGLPSTNQEQTRLAAINPDNYTSYPNGCTFACHFTNSGACGASSEKYNTNGYCMGYSMSRVSYSGVKTLLLNNSNKLPNTMLSTLTPVTSCPTDNTDACIQLRADAVGYAVQQLLLTANATEKMANQFRIGLYPFIRYLYAYSPLTTAINGSSTAPGTINYAAANLASQLDTGANASLGSGGTHFENAFPAINSIIPATVGDGSSTTSTLPYVFLVTDGAQSNQTYWSGSWSGSNSATTMDTSKCKTLRDRGVIVSVLYIPYQPIQNPTTFANSEDFYANANIPNIPPSLLACASPGYFYTANTPADIATSLNAMFTHALVTAHILN